MKLTTLEFEDAIMQTVKRVCFDKPSLKAMYEQKYVTREGARVVAMEHCAFANRYPSWFGNIIANCPHLDVRAYMIENMYVEEVKDPSIEAGHYGSLVDFTVALGVPEDEVRAYPGDIYTIVAMHYWDNVSRTKPWLEAFAAIPSQELYKADRIRKKFGQPSVDAKRWAPLGLKGKAMDHWTAADDADLPEDGHGEATLKILLKYADTEDKQQAVLHSLEETLRVKMFRDELIGHRAFEASGIPIPATR